MQRVLQELISAIGCERAVVFFGAGPSSEIELLNWSSLASSVANTVYGILEKKLNEIDRCIQEKDFPHAFGIMERELKRRGLDGRSIIEKEIQDLLVDNGLIGSIYTSLAKLPVHLYMTTNYDSVFERHLFRIGKSPEVYNNTKTSLEEVDPASYEKSLIHVHGSFKHGGHLIITDTDYLEIQKKPEFAAVRMLIESHLCSSPVVIIGYSLTDPDLRFVSRSVAAIVRRTHPVIALIADADNEQVSELSQDYNIQVLPYQSHNHHKELKDMLSTVVNWLQNTQVRQTVSQNDMKAAQTLYIYDVAKSAKEPLVKAAVKSLIIVAAYEASNGLEEDMLKDKLREVAGARPDDSLISQALSECIEENLLDKKDTKIVLTDIGSRMLDLSNRKYLRLWGNLYRHLESVLGMKIEIDGILENVLIGLFSERAAEAVGLAFCDQAVETSSMNLFEVISSRIQDVDNNSVRLCIINYIIDMLRKPNKQQREIMIHLGRSLFCTHALKIDIEAHNAFSSFVDNRALILDSNILIPLLALGCPTHQSIKTLIQTALDNGMKCLTTPLFITETLNHIEWAANFIRDNSENESIILSAARGFGVWQGNEFLSGLIKMSNEKGSRINFNQYCRLCIGVSRLSQKSIKQYLKDEYSTEVLDPNSCRSLEEFTAIRDDTYQYIKDNSSSNKSDLRKHAEAEAYAIIHEWRNFEKSDATATSSTLFSYGGYLNHIASKSTHALGFNVVITPYSLGAFVEAYLNPDATSDFGTIVRSEFFNTASDFIEDTELQQYFTTLINAADRVYEEQLRPRLAELDTGLFPEDLPNTLDEIPPLERPDVVRVLSTLYTDYTSYEHVKEMKREIELTQKEAEQARQRAERAEKLLEKRRRGQRRYERSYSRRSKKKK